MEEWKYIKGYEDFYMISNKGRIKSLEKNIGNRKYKSKIKKYFYKNNIPYITLFNVKTNKKETFRVDYLVANHFLEKTGKYLLHKNNIESDCRYENLEWVDKLKINTTKKDINKKISAIKENKLIVIKSCSRDMATYLLENHFLLNVTVETAARNIRKAIINNTPYHKIYFSYTN